LGGLSFTIVHIGKLKAPFVRSGIEHYRKKILPLASLEFKTVREEPLRKGLSLTEVHRREAERLRKTRDARAVWVVLEEKSDPLGSEAFAARLEEWTNRGRSRFAFLVGGPSGVASEIREEADLVLSLSPMTLSHEMALLVLMEQLYRALAIINRLPYPREDPGIPRPAHYAKLCSRRLGFVQYRAGVTCPALLAPWRRGR
jgi:23S rRNA (pseudouridine1915-N3)-methyltransferase